MINLDSVALQCCVALAETGSFTRAAEKIGRTQSAVSQQIARLEEALGVTLFHRATPVAPTTDGEVFCDYARRILKLHREVTDRFRAPEMQGEIRFGAPEDFVSVFLSDVLAEFSELHPRVRLMIDCDLTLNLLERFRKGALDVVLLKMTKPEDFPNGVDVWQEKLEWVGKAPDMRHRGPETEDDGGGGEETVPLVLSPQPCVYRARAIDALDRAGMRWRQVYTSASLAGKIAAVRAGMGVTVLPRKMIPEGLHVVRRLPALEDIHVSLVTRKRPEPAMQGLAEQVLASMR